MVLVHFAAAIRPAARPPPTAEVQAPDALLRNIPYLEQIIQVADFSRGI
jgi:hypothetical protein